MKTPKDHTVIIKDDTWSVGSSQRVFTLDEMIDSWEAGANDMFNTHLGEEETPDKKQYFLDKFGIDISDMKK